MAIKGMKDAIGRWFGWFLCLLGLAMVVFNVTLLSTLHAGTATCMMIATVSLTAYFLIANIEMDMIKKYQNKFYIALLVLNVVFFALLFRAFSWASLMFAASVVSLVVVLKNERESFEKNKKTIVSVVAVLNISLTFLVLWFDRPVILGYLVYLGAAVAAFFAWSNLMSIFWDQKKRGFTGTAFFEGLGWAYAIFLLVTTGATWVVNLLWAPILTLVGMLLILVVEKKMIGKKLLVYIKN
ncbi:MAG: hypothetical protein ACTSU5_13110 [Promethearchaeota archaeon]